MLLTKDNVCTYVLESGLVDRAAAVGGDLAVTAAPTRNNIFKVLQLRGRSCFVKQPFTFDPATTQFLNREARTYELVNQHERYRATAAFLPRLLRFDREQHVLAVEYIPQTTSVHEMILRQRQFFPELAARMGEILAHFHFPVPADADVAFLPRQPPWVLQIPNFPAESFFPHHAPITALIRTVQSHPLLSSLLSRLKAEWRGDSLLHGDIKWANFITSSGDGGVLRLIDWEMADIGDPAWDVAGLFQSYVCAWVFGFDDQRPDSYEMPGATADFHISRMHSSVASFWSAYVRGRGLDEGEARLLLQKAVRLLGCRMIQTAVEGAVRSPAVPANSMRTVQVACNILQRPDDAARELLGLTLLARGAP